MDVELERCIQFEAREETEKTRRGPPAVVIILLLLLLCAVAFFLVRDWLYSQQLETLTTALGSTPGLYVTDIERDGQNFIVRGLQDPLASSVVDVAESVDISADRLRVMTEPFQSLQPEIVAARAAQMFGRPGSVSFDVSGTTLAVTGEAPWQWQRELKARFDSLVGVDSLDISGLIVSDRQQFMDRIAALNERKFFFRRGIEFADGNEEGLRKYASELRDLQKDAADLDFSVNVSLVGSADSSGTGAINTALADRRANVVAGVLASSGVTARVVRRPDQVFGDGEAREDLTKRFVEINLQTQSLSDLP